jgi:hypothetical protein
LGSVEGFMLKKCLKYCTSLNFFYIAQELIPFFHLTDLECLGLENV